jgi:hypothetical protein
VSRSPITYQGHYGSRPCGNVHRKTMCPGHSNQTHLWVGRFRGHARGGEGSPSHAEWRHFPTINALAVAIEFGDGWIGIYIGTSTVAKCLGQCTLAHKWQPQLITRNKVSSFPPSLSQT